MRSSHADENENLLPAIRYFLGYVWLIVLFGMVILIVQASMDIKKLGYTIADQVTVKIELMNQVQQADNEISKLESYQRIAALIQEHRPELATPRQPAIEIEVAGLSERNGLPEPTFWAAEPPTILDTVRKKWKSAGERIQAWIQSLLE